jgi:tetratricopeptide (TPR) repeat protein
MTNPELDAEELFHLAVHATNDGRTDNAITYLKQAIALEDDNPWTHYLLGAQYAELQMYGRAIESMEKSIALDSSISIAAFQLGMLYGVTDQVDEAKRVWELLEELDNDDAIKLFKNGMLALIADDFVNAESNLARGIERNTTNPALNKDMQRVLDNLRSAQDDAGDTPASTTTRLSENVPESGDIGESEDERQANPLLVSIYDAKKKH